MNTLFSKIFRMTAALILGSVVLVGVLVVSLVQMHLSEQREAAISRYERDLQSIIQAAEHAEAEELAFLLHVFVSATGTRITVLGYGDEMIYATAAQPNVYEFISVTGTDGYLMARFAIDMPERGLEPLARAILVLFIFISAFVVPAAAMLALFTSRKMAAPLLNIRDSAVAFGSGDLSARAKQYGGEAGELANAFNAMADNIERAELVRVDFVANVSHEMRTPMTNVIGYLDGIIDKTLPRDYLSLVRDEMLRLSRLVGRMLELTKVQSITPDKSRFDLCELVLRVLIGFETAANTKSLDVTVDFPPDAMIYADRDIISQVVFNLIDNAVKFAHENTQLTLRIENKNGKCHCIIQNIGDTIPADLLPQLTDRFYKRDTSRSNDSGLGLGLHLVKAFLDAHGEKLTIHSHSGVTTVGFSL